jgi:hypothetical protein
MRALKAMGLKPTVFHMNEGHSAFLALEQIRWLMRDEGLGFDEALEAARASNVFTTHTPVPAGIDIFDAGLMYHYFADYCNEVKIDFQQLMALGGATFSTATSRSPWRCWRCILRPFATPSAGCTAKSRRRCSTTCGRSFRCGRCRSPPSPTASICPVG